MTELVTTGGSASQRTASALVSRAFAYDADVLPLAYDGSTLTVAMTSESPELVDRVRHLARKEIRAVVMSVREIREGLNLLSRDRRARRRFAGRADPR